MSGTVKVLLVEDDPDMLFLLDTMLSADRWDIVGKATGGESALRMAAANPPDLAVIDYMMPGLNGLEVADRIHATHPACYILIYSAHPTIGDEARRRASVDDFLEKDQVLRLEDVLEEIARARGLVT